MPPPPAPPPAPAARRRPPERPEAPRSCSWPSSSLGRPPARRAPPGPAGAPAPAAPRCPLSAPPEAVLLLQRRHLQKPLLAPPARPRPPPPPSPAAPAPAPARCPPGPRPRAPPGPRPGPGPRPRRPQAPPPRAALPASLLDERHRYDDVEYEDAEAPPRDDGLVRRCTEWLRGVEAAARARDRAGPLDALPHLSTL
ncbi:Proline-rich protein 18 [Vulpes lagopus]